MGPPSAGRVAELLRDGAVVLLSEDRTDDRESATWWLTNAQLQRDSRAASNRASAPNNLGLLAVIRGNPGLSGQFSHYRLAIPPTLCPYVPTPLGRGFGV